MPAEGLAQILHQSTTDAIRYWEPRRAVYNSLLAMIVVTYFALGYPSSMRTLSANTALLVFLLAVLANVAYTTAYAVDIFVQLSEYQSRWRKHRWMLFVFGSFFACLLTRFWAVNMFLGRP